MERPFRAIYKAIEDDALYAHPAPLVGEAERAVVDEVESAKRAVFDAAGTYQVLDIAHDLAREAGHFKGEEGEPRRVASLRAKCDAEDALDAAVLRYSKALAAARGGA